MDYKPLTLQYRNDDDKAYGLAGMIFSLNALGALDIVNEVSLDTDGPMVTFSADYYFFASPAISPKAVWQQTKRNWYLTSSMVVANVMARALVRDGEQIPSQILDDIRSQILREGADTLSLEEDEAGSLFDNLYRKNLQIFYNPRIQPVVRSLTRTLALRRSLSFSDLIDLLSTL